MGDVQLKIAPADALVQKQLAEVRRLENGVGGKESLRDASEDFESLFVFFLLRTMRKTVMKSGLIKSGIGNEVMQSLFDQELSKKIARSTNLGIAELLEQQLAANKKTNAPEEIKGVGSSEFKLPKLERPSFKKRGANRFLKDQLLHRLKPYESHISAAAAQTGVNPNLIRAVILAESSGDPKAKSAAGASGLMQLMEATARQLGVRNPLDPRENILGGSRYLSKLLQQFNGNLKLALAGYNAGPDTVKRYRDVPPFKETREYVRKVLGYLNQLNR